MTTEDILRAVLMYGVLPLWLLAGFADYLCHRAARIEHTSGVKESALHLLQLGEVAVAVTAVLFLEVTSGVFLLMLGCLLAHAVTAIWDVAYASATRGISPTEQHVHGVLEMMPVTAVLLVGMLHWPAVSELFAGQPDLSIRWRHEPLPVAYVGTMLAVTALFEVLPYLEELARTIRWRREATAPSATASPVHSVRWPRSGPRPGPPATPERSPMTRRTP